MDYAVTAREILEQVGGEQNVASATHCMTRLRLVLKDESGVDDEKIKSIPGVVGVMRKSGQYQIIIGNNVAKCFAEFNKLGNFADESASGAKKAKGKRKINPVSAVLDAISGSIAPIIPAIIGVGMIRVLYIILNFWIPAENNTMTVLNAIADAAFYFLPILIAFSAGKKFGANPYLAAAVISDELAQHGDFFSIGTNDLTQYTLAADRQNEKLEGFCNPHHEAILRLIEMTVKNGHKAGIWVGICGELGADLSLTREFIRMGVDELSVSPAMILKLRKNIVEMNAD